ncbi:MULTISPECIES: hypothetical protein [Pseudomonas]|uniref:hypothetical protein n=1 Tax=Pseudomonas TaxID=286 RepID=UPI000DAA1118|nr:MULTISPECIES: hypothetical protein [Pseudomonas]MDW3710583.1 hypothetical protein [Pseudomonas sp. 2023EL-01195]PZE10180.1 hypothetical protein DMX10_27285 [Pseudomonas sp. 57B-090624]
MRYPLTPYVLSFAACACALILLGMAGVIGIARRNPHYKALWLSLFSIGAAYLVAIALLVVSGLLLEDMDPRLDHPFAFACATLTTVFAAGTLRWRISPLKALLHLLPSLLSFAIAYVPALFIYGCATTPVCL